MKWTFLVLLALLAVASAIPVFNVAREPAIKSNCFFYHIEDGFQYNLNVGDGQAGVQYFKCVKYETGCRGRAILDPVYGFVHSNPHNHAADLDYPAEICLRNAIIRRCTALECVPFQRIIDEEGARFNEEVRSRVTIRRMRTPMTNARLRPFPNVIPTLRDLSNVLLDPQSRVLTMTVDGNDFIYGGSVTDANEGHHVLFTSQRMLQQMRLFRVLHSDGTFRTVPVRRGFAAQVFCIVGVWAHHIIPLAWVLMESAEEVAYTAVLELLAALLGPQIDLRRAITDFETAQQNAWQNVFHVQVQGCLWHLARAYMEQVASLDLIRQMRRIQEVRQIIRLTLGLAVLPENMIVRGFRVLLQHARAEGNYIFNIVRPYLMYINTYWISRPWRRRRMCVHGSSQRTNNACESHNRQLRTTVGLHPNIYDFIRGLLTLEQRAHNTLFALRNNRRVMRGQRRTSILNNERVQNAIGDLLQPAQALDRHILQFLITVSHTLDGIVNAILDDPRN